MQIENFFFLWHYLLQSSIREFHVVVKSDLMCDSFVLLVLQEGLLFHCVLCYNGRGSIARKCLYFSIIKCNKYCIC